MAGFENLLSMACPITNTASLPQKFNPTKKFQNHVLGFFFYSCIGFCAKFSKPWFYKNAENTQ
jgi:hypothetical protein